MRYWDNDIDRLIDEAIDEINRKERAELEHLNSVQQNIDISNPMKLYGAI